MADAMDQHARELLGDRLRKVLRGALAPNYEIASSGYRAAADALLDAGEIFWSHSIEPPGPARYKYSLVVEESGED